VTYAATMRRALELGVIADLIVAGPVDPIQSYYAAFDVFLNTSIYEGMSIATMEAVQNGCPVVTADVGGQREAVGPTDYLIPNPAEIEAYVEAIRAVALRRERKVRDTQTSNLVSQMWAWIATYGVDVPRQKIAAAAADTLFVTSNMNPGGAQRSLTNLLAALVTRDRPFLCVLGPTYDGNFLGRLRAVNLPVVSVADSHTTIERAGRVVDLAARLGVRNICFWNADPAVKLIVTKVHEASRLRVVDVSPGPMLFRELDQHEVTQRRIAMTGAQYFRRLDRFVAKYTNGGPPGCYDPDNSRVTVVPNGVSTPDLQANDTLVPDLLPAGADPNLAVVASTRIAPNKCVEELLDIALHLADLIPGATISVIGGVDPRHVKYWERVKEKLSALGLQNVHFAGPRQDAERVLGQFRVFVMISRAQGCPNASLEAMAAGLPAVANDDGGTREQIVHGETGFVVPGEDTRTMAEHVAWLLRNPERARAMGDAARRRVMDQFSMTRMVEGYCRILEAE
jgi:glycosyltransferase involved in cell wall biosynthesis